MGNRNKVLYWVSTGLLSLMMLMSATMYFVRHQEIVDVFVSLSYPSYLIYPLAIAKVLGLIAIWTRKSTALREWAYAGFFFDFSLAVAAHLQVRDGDHIGGIMALVLLAISYFSGRKHVGVR